MPMDATDQKLIKGVIIFALLGVGVYYYPFESPVPGIQKEQEDQEAVRRELAEIKDEFESKIAPQHPAVWDQEGELKPMTDNKRPISEQVAMYQRRIKQLEKDIAKKQEISRMSFAKWAEVPAAYEKIPGTYFANLYNDRQSALRKEWRTANVDVLDDQLGFTEWTGNVDKINTPEIATELLRKLFIVETVIKLCIKAKEEQTAVEVSQNRKPEAFMQIISVRPEDSDAVGPVALVKNDLFNPEEKNPKSDRFRMYNIKTWRAFIQEYPVEIQLRCDVNSFKRFLHSVRSPGHFLVIRRLEVISPSINDSNKNKVEYNNIAKAKGLSAAAAAEVPKEHIWVRMSAAGMDFFDPDEKSGIYATAKAGKAAAKKKKEAGQQVRPRGY